MLQVTNLVVDHGKLRALWDVSLRIGKGERVGLLGANGAGKSTTLGAVLGIYRATAGSIRFNDVPIVDRSVAANVAAGISLVPEGRRLFPEMIAAENLQMGAFQPAA